MLGNVSDELAKGKRIWVNGEICNLKELKESADI
jgi:hypothetical protein